MANGGPLLFYGTGSSYYNALPIKTGRATTRDAADYSGRLTQDLFFFGFSLLLLLSDEGSFVVVLA